MFYSLVYFNFNLDKIYEARHKLLNLYPEPVVEAKIPSAYFLSTEQDFNSSALVEILSSVPNSPLTPGGLLQTFSPIAPNASFPNKIACLVHDFSNLTPDNLRYHAMQQQSFPQIGNQENTFNMITNGVQTYSNVSPRSINSNTSGYLSQLSHTGSLNNSCSSNLLNGDGMSKQPDSRIIIGTPISKNLNQNDIPFEVNNRLLTPSYHSVSVD